MPKYLQSGNYSLLYNTDGAEYSFQIYCGSSFILTYTQWIILLVKIKLLITDLFGEVGQAIDTRPIPFPD